MRRYNFIPETARRMLSKPDIRPKEIMETGNSVTSLATVSRRESAPSSPRKWTSLKICKMMKILEAFPYVFP